MFIVYFVLKSIDVILDYILFNNYFVQKKCVTACKLLLYALILAFICTSINTYKDCFTASFLIMIISMLLMCRNFFDGSIKKMIVCVSFYYIIWLCLDALVRKWITNSFVIREDNPKIFPFFVYLFFKFILIQVVLLKRNHYFKEQKVKLHLIQMFLPIISFISILYLLLQEVSLNENTILKIYIMIVVLSIFNFVQYYSIDQLDQLQNVKNESSRTKELYKYKDDYYHKLEMSQCEIRTIKHDLKNELILLKTYLNRKMYQYAEAEIDGILQDILTIEEYHFTGNLIVNALLNAKFKQARELDIVYTISVSMPEKMNISDRDMAALLGNLIDNCIEACNKVEGNKNINLKIFYNNGAVVIHSTNTTDGKIQGVDTRKQNKFEHGLGLKSILAIVNKYQGNMKLTADKNTFCLDIIIWDTGEKLENKV